MSRFLPIPADRCRQSLESNPIPARWLRESDPQDLRVAVATVARPARSRESKAPLAVAPWRGFAHSVRFPRRRILPFAVRVSASQVLIGDSQSSFAEFLNSC